MTWDPIPPNPSPDAHVPDATIAVIRAGTGKYAQRWVHISLKHTSDWMTSKLGETKRVSAQIGRGADVGRVRIAPSTDQSSEGGHPRVFGGGSGKRITVMLPPWDGLPEGSRPAAPCVIREIPDPAIIVTIPALSDWPTNREIIDRRSGRLRPAAVSAEAAAPVVEHITTQPTAAVVDAPSIPLGMPAVAPVVPTTMQQLKEALEKKLATQTPVPSASPPQRSRSLPVAADLPPKLTRAETIQRLSGGGAQAADLEQVRTWAVERGIQFRDWDDLPKVNRKREDLGLPTFARKFPQRGVRA